MLNCPKIQATKNVDYSILLSASTQYFMMNRDSDGTAVATGMGPGPTSYRQAWLVLNAIC
jgi:hypothetical protein